MSDRAGNPPYPAMGPREIEPTSPGNLCLVECRHSMPDPKREIDLPWSDWMFAMVTEIRPDGYITVFERPDFVDRPGRFARVAMAYVVNPEALKPMLPEEGLLECPGFFPDIASAKTALVRVVNQAREAEGLPLLPPDGGKP